MVSRRKCALLSVASILVIWFASSLLFLHQLKDQPGPVLLNSFPTVKADPNVVMNLDDNSAANVLNLKASKIAALLKENLELKRAAMTQMSTPKYREKSEVGDQDMQLPPVTAVIASPAQPKATGFDGPSFRAAFDKFEAFVLKPSEDRIPGAHFPFPLSHVCILLCVTRKHS
jgi:hypothetical protein